MHNIHANRTNILRENKDRQKCVYEEEKNDVHVFECIEW